MGVLGIHGKRRVLVAGDFAYAHYEEDFCTGLRGADVEVREFRASRLFGPGALIRRAQTKFVAGPGIEAANAALIVHCVIWRPGLVLAWRAPWLRRGTIRALRSLAGARVVIYTNDDPFGPDRDLRIWRAFRRGIRLADACLAYREVNVGDYATSGARRVGMLRSYFNPRLHHPIELSAADHARFGSDVVFVGHFEEDDRVECVDRLVRSGHRVRIFGSGWEDEANRRGWGSLLPITPVFGVEYVKAIAAAKIALAFLSKRNRDDYTRRCFEIPAIGTLMLAPRTDALRALFVEDEEAVFYSSPAEIVAQVDRLLTDSSLRSRIAKAGRARCVRDGHDVDSRARQFLESMEGLFEDGSREQ